MTPRFYIDPVDLRALVIAVRRRRNLERSTRLVMVGLVLTSAIVALLRMI